MKSTTVIAFDQHAATTVAAVLLPGQRTPALHPLTSDSPTILKFVERLRRDGPLTCCYAAGPCSVAAQHAGPGRPRPGAARAPRAAAQHDETDGRAPQDPH